MDGYIAHLKNESGKITVQPVAEHLRNVSNYCRENLCGIGLGSLGALCGLLHDMGKYSPAFQSYIRGAAEGEIAPRGSVDHSTAGALYLEECLPKEEINSRCVAESLEYAVLSHHGVTDCLGTDGKNFFYRRLQKDREELEYSSAKELFLKSGLAGKAEKLKDGAAREWSAVFAKIKDLDIGSEGNRQKAFITGLLERTVLSALIDADWRDSAEFNCPERRERAVKNDTSVLWTELNENAENYISEKQKSAACTPVNSVRAAISERAKKAGTDGRDGIFRLSLPTGAGKTLTSLSYALHYAKKAKKSRIFYVAPLLTILDQNAREIERAVGREDCVLVHSSDVIRENGTERDERYRELTENWDSPVVVTTLVQFLNTLFSAKSACVRRMHALANSVIIIDEVQSVPLKTTKLFNAAVNYLAWVCNCSVVLCSATQPNSKCTNAPLLGETELFSLTEAEKAVFERTRITDDVVATGISAEELADRIADDKSASILLICNTKKQATEVYVRLNRRFGGDTGVEFAYLSAGMCKKHREKALKRVYALLNDVKTGEAKRLVCVATQVVEAGVDVSFECVYRVYAGVDNIAQAAGRCNRNGEYGRICDVHIVKLNDENLRGLKEIKMSQDATLSVAYDMPLSLSDECIAKYYERLYAGKNNYLSYETKGGLLYDLLSLNSLAISSAEKKNFCFNQSFKTAGEEFCVFDEDTVTAIVPYDEEAKKYIAELCGDKCRYDLSYLNFVLQKLKPYTVNLYSYQVKLLEQSGGIYRPQYTDGINILQSFAYDPETGVTTEGRYEF